MVVGLRSRLQGHGTEHGYSYNRGSAFTHTKVFSAMPIRIYSRERIVAHIRIEI
jgi:hypothetical protein